MRRVSSESIREPKGILKASSKYVQPSGGSTGAVGGLNSSRNSVYESVLKEHGNSVLKKERESKQYLSQQSLDKSQQSILMNDRSITSLRKEPRRADSSTTATAALKREQLDLSTESKQFLLNVLPEKPPANPVMPSALNSKRISTELVAKNPKGSFPLPISSSAATTSQRFFSALSSPQQQHQPQAFAQLRDLCPEDKRKVGQLMQRLSDEKQEKERLKQKLQLSENLFNERLEAAQRDKQSITETTNNLQDRIQHTTKLLRDKSLELKGVSNILIPTPKSIPIRQNSPLSGQFFSSTEENNTPINALIATSGIAPAKDTVRLQVQDSLDEEVHDFLQQSIQNQQPLSSQIQPQQQQQQTTTITQPPTATPQQYPSRKTSQQTFSFLAAAAATAPQQPPNTQLQQISSLNPFAKCVAKTIALPTSPTYKSNVDLFKNSSQFQLTLDKRATHQQSMQNLNNKHAETLKSPQRVTLQKNDGQSEKLFNQWKSKCAAKTSDKQILADPYRSEHFFTRAEDIKQDDTAAVAEIASLKAAMQQLVGSLQSIGSPDYFSVPPEHKQTKQQLHSTVASALVNHQHLVNDSDRGYNDEEEEEDLLNTQQNEKLALYLKQKQQKLSSVLQDIRQEDFMDQSDISLVKNKKPRTKKAQAPPVVPSQKKSKKQAIDSSTDDGYLNKLQAKLTKSGLTTKSIDSLSKHEIKQLKAQLERKQQELSESVSYEVSSQNSTHAVNRNQSHQQHQQQQQLLQNRHAGTASNNNYNNIQSPLKQSMNTNTFDVSYTTQLHQSLKESDNNLRFSNQSQSGVAVSSSNLRVKSGLRQDADFNDRYGKRRGNGEGNENGDNDDDDEQGSYILVEENSSMKKKILAKIDQLTEEDMASVLQVIRDKKAVSSRPTEESVEGVRSQQSSNSKNGSQRQSQTQQSSQSNIIRDGTNSQAAAAAAATGRKTLSKQDLLGGAANHFETDFEDGGDRYYNNNNTSEQQSGRSSRNSQKQKRGIPQTVEYEDMLFEVVQQIEEASQRSSQQRSQKSDHQKPVVSSQSKKRNGSGSSLIDLQRMEQYLHMDSSLTETDKSIQEIKQRISLQS